jgi:redox-sensitive bicupin YhaK (pirin superfamily)
MPFDIFSVPSTPGSPLRAVLPEEGTNRFDPFLVPHAQGPVRYAPGEAIGFDDHPHRGFDTVNCVIAGQFRVSNSDTLHVVFREDSIVSDDG